MRTRVLLLVVLAAGCKPSVDPNQGKYTCTTTADCGPDYECKAQLAGGSLCFKKGTCFAETCNGKDDDCNGGIDETFPMAKMLCTSSALGECAPGRFSCIDAGTVCVSEVKPIAELCNGKDDDCDGMTDETFTLATDDLNCGVCGNACAPGTSCQLGACRETNCADGLDNDGDGGLDCADPACQQRTCFTNGDAGFVCGKLPDAGTPDAGTPDAGTPDAGDGGEPDGGIPDAGIGLDAGIDAGLDDGGRFFCFPVEQCDDGTDNDQDFLTDCEDPDCNGRTCASGTVCTNFICPGPG